jgi:hypothetical protein
MRYVIPAGILACLVPAAVNVSSACTCRRRNDDGADAKSAPRRAWTIPSQDATAVACDTRVILHYPNTALQYKPPHPEGISTGRTDSITLEGPGGKVVLVEGRHPAQYFDTQQFDLSPPLQPNTAYRLALHTSPRDGNKKTQIIRFVTGSCRVKRRLTAPQVQSIVVTPATPPGRSCSTGRPEIRISFTPGRRDKRTAPIHALYVGRKEIDWTRPFAFVRHPGLATLGRASVCASRNDVQIPFRSGPVRFGLRALAFDGTSSESAVSRQIQIPRSYP